MPEYGTDAAQPTNVITLFSYQEEEDGDAYLQKPRRTKRRKKEKCLTRSVDPLH